MRLTYRRVIELTLGRQETKLYRESEAYRAELAASAMDMANERSYPVEIYLSSWGREDGANPLALEVNPGDKAVTHSDYDRHYARVVSA